MNMNTFWILLTFSALLVSFFIFWPLRKRHFLFITCLLSFAAISLGLYYYWGSFQQVESYYAGKQKAQQVQKMLKQYKNTHEIINAMKRAIAKNPNKAKGWYLLGQLYRAENDSANAVPAFHRAYELKPHSFKYTFAYLQSLYAQNNQQYTPEIRQLMQQLSQNWPDRPELLDFLGYDAYMHGDYASAITNWEKLLPYLSDNPKAHQAILLAIGKAEKKLLK